MNAPTLPLQIASVGETPPKIKTTPEVPSADAVPVDAVHESPELADYLKQIESAVEREKADRRAQEEFARLRELARYD